MDHLSQSKKNCVKLILAKVFSVSVNNKKVIIGHNPLKQFRVTVQINSKNEFGIINTLEFTFDEFQSLWKQLKQIELKPGINYKISGTKFSLWTTVLNNELYYIIFNTNNFVEESICIDEKCLKNIFCLEDIIFEELNFGKSIQDSMLDFYRKSLRKLSNMYANEEINTQLMKKKNTRCLPSYLHTVCRHK